MSSAKVEIDCRQIVDWATFHALSAKAFGFPEFYGQNLPAWIDCLTCLDDANCGMTKVAVSEGDLVVLQLRYAKDLKVRCPEIYLAILESAALVNWRRMELGKEPVLAVAIEAAI